MHFEYGRLLEQLGRLEEAVQQFDACVAAQPNRPAYADAALRVRRKLKQ
jgi:hypothetical protein